jgi:hypothetical protein
VYAREPLRADDGFPRDSEDVLIAKARGAERHAGKSVPMKFLPTTLCGVLLVLSCTATNAFAQSSTTTGGAGTKSQTTSSAPAATAPSNRSISPLTPGQPAPPKDPITLAQTRQLLDLMDYKKIEQSNWSR